MSRADEATSTFVYHFSQLYKHVGKEFSHEGASEIAAAIEDIIAAAAVVAGEDEGDSLADHINQTTQQRLTAAERLIGVLLRELGEIAHANLLDENKQYGLTQTLRQLECELCQGAGIVDGGDDCENCGRQGFGIPLECRCKTSAGESRGYCLVCRGEQVLSEVKRWSR